MKLGIGTVQFGLEYGIANRGRSMPDEGEIRALFKTAAGSGVDMVDTAYQYGDSEEVLARTLPGNRAWRVVTKTPPLGRGRDADEKFALINEGLRASLERLGRESVYGLLIHDARELDISDNRALWEKMQGLKESGKVEKIGFSAYAPRQIEELLDSCKPDIVQVPVSLFDQRMEQEGTLERLKQQGVEVHARSLFLQGLAFMPMENLPEFFKPVRDNLQALRSAMKEHGCTAPEATYGYLKSLDGVDCAVVGVMDNAQLRENLHALKNGRFPFSRDEMDAMRIDDEKFLHPYRWEV